MEFESKKNPKYKRFYNFLGVAVQKTNSVCRIRGLELERPEFLRFLALVHKNLAYKKNIDIPPDYYPEVTDFKKRI